MKVSFERFEFELIDIQSLDFPLMAIEDLKDIKPLKMKIIGYLVKKDKLNYYVAKEVWESKQFKYVHIIPINYVTKKRFLK